MSGRQIIEAARKEKRAQLSEIEAKQLLREAGIGVVDTMLATCKEEAVALSETLGYPVAMKIASVDVSHKSDIGGVKLSLNGRDQVADAYDRIMENVKGVLPDAGIDGVTVQTMARPGVEVIIGMSKDAEFGPVLMFGLGGIFVEILKDVSFRIVPLEPQDAREMIREIKGFPLLQGYRGSEAVDIAGLENILLNLSRFLEENPEIKELDLNPILAYSDGALAVDARVILEKSA